MKFSARNHCKLSDKTARLVATRVVARVLSACILLATVGTMAEERESLKSKWDTAIPTMELQDVHLQAAGSTVFEVWRDVASQTGVRAVLFTTEPEPESETKDNQRFAFGFDRAKCAVRDLLKAFEGAFPQYVFTQDPETGVLWLHTTNATYNDILSGKIKVTRTATAIPMITGILGPLVNFRSLHLAPAFVTGGAFATYDYPVDLPAGTYSLRQIINYCCVACPDRTLDFAPCPHDSYGYSGWLVCSISMPPPPGVVYFWQTEIDPSVLEMPSEDQLIAALVSRDLRIRLAARKYLTLSYAVNERHKYEIISRAVPEAQAMWTAIGFCSVNTYGLGTQSPPSTRRMLEVFDEHEDLSGEPGLKALAAVELARVVHKMEPLREMAKRPLSSAEIADVKYDLIRNLHYSKALLDQLAALNPPWAGFSRAEIEELGRMDNLFSLP